MLGRTEIPFLGFKATLKEETLVCYIDTERNINDQFPYALQEIQRQAGYKITDEPNGFRYTSVIKIPRKDRLNVLRRYVQHIRSQSSSPLIIILDVITDFILDFNRVDESLQFIDWMNECINEYNISFIGIIHENPGSEKARGHVGTELHNKVTTNIQIAPDRELESEGVFKITFKKNRNTHRLPPIYLRYDEGVNNLVIVEKDAIDELRNDRKDKAPISDVSRFLLENLLPDGMAGKQLISMMETAFAASDKTIRERLSFLTERKIPLESGTGIKYYLGKEQKGQGKCYSLKIIN